MSELYRLSDIFFFPSRREGLPNTLLEAMACGLPSVVSLLPGSTDKVITSEENGYLVQGNSEEYVERILLLLDNEKLKTKMGRKARERVLNNYSLNRCVKQYIDLYNKLCFPEISE